MKIRRIWPLILAHINLFSFATILTTGTTILNPLSKHLVQESMKSLVHAGPSKMKENNFSF
ncbi:hypothetical protein ACJX0J_030448, partial [Zea mays]